MEIILDILPVNAGDSVLLKVTENEKTTNVFVDSGYVGTYKCALKPKIMELLSNEEKIDLFIITHVDMDHIGGVLAFIKDPAFEWEKAIDKFWFNCYEEKVYVNFTNKIGYKEGIELKEVLLEKNKLEELIFFNKNEKMLKALTFTFLSPDKGILQEFLEESQKINSSTMIGTKKSDYEKSIEDLFLTTFNEDLDLKNKSSLAFIVNIGDIKILFGGDASANTLLNSLNELGYNKKNKIKIDYFKLSHHGSKNNIHLALLEVIDCRKFIISTNGSGNPDKTSLSWIIKNPDRNHAEKISFIFNYKNDKLMSIFTEEDMEKYNFECLFPEGEKNGYTIRI